MDWFGNQRLADLAKHNKRNMEKAVRVVRNEVVKLLGTKGPPRSTEGNPPHIETNALRLSIATEVVQQGSDTTGRVGTNIEYAKYLELPSYLNRPFLMPAIDNTRDAVKDILATEMK